MDKQVIFFDIDGTLVYNHQGVSSKVIEALKRTREKGNLTFLCTGRNYKGVKELMQYGFDGAICSAGAYIVLNDNVIYEDGFTNEDVQYIVSVFNQHHINYLLEASDTTFQTEQMSYMFALVEDLDPEVVLERNKATFDIQKASDYMNESIKTICYACKKEEVELFASTLAKDYTFLRYQSVNKNYAHGELMVKGLDKGFGMKKLMELLKIPMENTIAFGDSANDYEMIQTAHLGIVMGNGDDDLKAIANRVCESVQDDGIYYELERLELI